MHGFEDISLIPRIISEIESRDEIDISINNDFFKLKCPIIASPMKDVCDGKVACKMQLLGGTGIIHRFLTIENQVEEYRKSKDSPCAVGVNGDFYERFQALKNEGCNIFCIDVANGANLRIKKVLEKLDSKFIVGNVASKECYQWLDSIPNVIGVRCGIAGGLACSTRNSTGIFHGMVSCIKECANVKKNTLLIADGGIKEPADLCKAIALGADMVMLGATIAATSDSPAEITADGKYKIYHGSASFEIQKEYKEVPKYIEGTTKLIEYKKESLENLIIRFSEGLKSSMSYFNAKTLDEYRKNVTYGSLK